METKTKDLGRRIKESRMIAKMTQSEFAHELGKTLRTIQKYESGEIEPNISVLTQMAELLDVDLSYLIGYEQKPFQIQSISDVLYFFYQLDRVTELKYDIKVDTESDFDKWNCEISFNRANSEESIFSRFAYIMSMFNSILYRRSRGWISPYEFNIIVDRFLAENKRYILHSTPVDNTGYQEFAEVYKGIDEAIERERLEQEKSIYPKTMMD